MTNFVHIRKLPPVPYGKSYPLFTRISLETTKTCTRACWFCPSEQRGKQVETMPDALYRKIVEELRGLNFAGVVQWFFVNEPLLDREHLARIAALRAACPKVTIHLTTNWDIYAKKSMDKQLDALEALFAAGVNSLNLNDYDHRGYQTVVDDYLMFHKQVVQADHCWKKLGPRKQVLSCGPLPEKIHSWTGYVTAESLAAHGAVPQGASPATYCPRPMRHIVVQYNGKVPLCCAVNPTTAEELGDVNKRTLVEVWNNFKFFQYRQRLQDGNRIQQCAGCDARVAYPHLVRRVKGVV